jgi:hypothetical protein
MMKMYAGFILLQDESNLTLGITRRPTRPHKQAEATLG